MVSAQGEERGLEGKMDGLGLVAAGEGEAGGEVTEVRVIGHGHRGGRGRF